jgi:hypothetical protein
MLTAAAATSAAGFLAAAMASALGPPFRVTARVLAALSALVLVLPGIELRASVALALGAAALASPLPCVLAAAGSLLVLVFPEAAAGAVSSVILGFGAALAAGAVSSTLEARLADGKPVSPLAGAAGAGLVVLLLRLDEGAILRWGFAVGSGPTRLEMRGAGLLLGLALLASLAGTLLVLAHRLAPTVEGAGDVGLRLLLPAASLALLAVAHVTLQAVRQGRELLPADADVLVGLLVLAGALSAALAAPLRVAPPAAPEFAAGWAERETAAAASLVWLAAALAGWECWRTEGTYLCARTAIAVSTGLVGLAATAPTALAGTRRALLLVVLVLAVLFPGLAR